MPTYCFRDWSRELHEVVLPMCDVPEDGGKILVDGELWTRDRDAEIASMHGARPEVEIDTHELNFTSYQLPSAHVPSNRLREIYPRWDRNGQPVFKGTNEVKRFVERAREYHERYGTVKIDLGLSPGTYSRDDMSVSKPVT